MTAERINISVDVDALPEMLRDLYHDSKELLTTRVDLDAIEARANTALYAPSPVGLRITAEDVLTLVTEIRRLLHHPMRDGGKPCNIYYGASGVEHQCSNNAGHADRHDGPVTGRYIYGSAGQ